MQEGSLPGFECLPVDSCGTFCARLFLLSLDAIHMGSAPCPLVSGFSVSRSLSADGNHCFVHSREFRAASFMKLPFIIGDLICFEIFYQIMADALLPRGILLPIWTHNATPNATQLHKLTGATQVRILKLWREHQHKSHHRTAATKATLCWT